MSQPVILVEPSSLHCAAQWLIETACECKQLLIMPAGVINQQCHESKWSPHSMYHVSIIYVYIHTHIYTYTNICIIVHFSIYQDVCGFWALANVAEPPAFVKDNANVWNEWPAKLWFIHFLVTVKGLFHNNSVLPVDTTINLARTNFTYLLAGTHRLTACQLCLVVTCSKCLLDLGKFLLQITWVCALCMSYYNDVLLVGFAANDNSNTCILSHCRSTTLISIQVTKKLFNQKQWN